MLPVSQDCPFLIAPSVFSDIYFHRTVVEMQIFRPVPMILRGVLINLRCHMGSCPGVNIQTNSHSSIDTPFDSHNLTKIFTLIVILGFQGWWWV
jgi:hypothetical protein